LRHRREQPLDQLQELARLRRLVALNAAVPGDLSQSLGRDVAGQDDDRDLPTERLAQLRRDVEAVLAARQIVIGNQDIRANRSAGDQRQGVSALRGGRSPMAFVREEEVEHLADRRIVIDEQDRAAAAGALAWRSLPPA